MAKQRQKKLIHNNHKKIKSIINVNTRTEETRNSSNSDMDKTVYQSISKME